MSKTYVIRWRSKVNGRIGKGTRLFDKEEAESLVTELNTEFPDIEHEVVDAGNIPPERTGEEPAGDEQKQPQHVLSE